MLKSLDWAKVKVERRATLMTSLDCIFAVEKISGGKAAIECYVEKEK